MKGGHLLIEGEFTLQFRDNGLACPQRQQSNNFELLCLKLLETASKEVPRCPEVLSLYAFSKKKKKKTEFPLLH